MGENSSVTAAPPPPRGKSSAEEDALLKQFFAELSEVERDNEVNRILSCFKLNPFEYLNMSFDSSIDDVKKQYRKLSLLVHPDKCKHPQAKEAFGGTLCCYSCRGEYCYFRYFLRSGKMFRHSSSQ
ncbi:uncharacterized protein [Nicotiana sylvestris]|uniref:DnaJ homolog subfamily C member 8 isoform X2 n=2 Tax=Nicotiana TaxID=4085 RepID=A0A1S4AHT7_TOBAC|nr:PREDICTED: dnaJ homolog subfamily C member 8-like isoform X2 [Nicotiana sylvestris]XP_016476257.1 PREDICTED: dnaJ homolog subfamily C member 8-like isoform X2 [Nicotiana tabacum]